MQSDIERLKREIRTQIWAVNVKSVLLEDAWSIMESQRNGTAKTRIDDCRKAEIAKSQADLVRGIRDHKKRLEALRPVWGHPELRPLIGEYFDAVIAAFKRLE